MIRNINQFISPLSVVTSDSPTTRPIPIKIKGITVDNKIEKSLKLAKNPGNSISSLFLDLLNRFPNNEPTTTLTLNICPNVYSSSAISFVKGLEIAGNTVKIKPVQILPARIRPLPFKPKFQARMATQKPDKNSMICPVKNTFFVFLKGKTRTSKRWIRKPKTKAIGISFAKLVITTPNGA